MERDFAADVVVIGGGLAGYCAALAAAEAGADVLLLEKQAQVGGSTVLSGGYFAFAGTDLQAAHGVTDSNELLFSDLRAVGEEKNDPALVGTYVNRQFTTYEWLRKNDIKFNLLEQASGQSVPRAHRARPLDVINTLSQKADDTGRVRIFVNVAVQRLDRNDHGIEVVRAHFKGSECEIAVRSGLVIASGGFSRSEALLETFAPSQSQALRMGGSGNTGDGLRMAWELGANFRDMGYIKGTFGAHPRANGDISLIILALYRGAIAVNRQARRFVDESLSYKLLGDACLSQPDGIVFQIFDHTLMAKSAPGAPLYDFAYARQRGFMVEADDLVGLAEKIGLNATTLKATIDAYNRDVDAGRDATFGRDGLTHHAGALARIETPPFYAYPSTSALLATYGGLAVDPEMRVYNVFNEPIDGLFAAGEVVGGFHGASSMTGSSLGKSAIFGRIAGQSAAKHCSTK